MVSEGNQTTKKYTGQLYLHEVQEQIKLTNEDRSQGVVIWGK